AKPTAGVGGLQSPTATRLTHRRTGRNFRHPTCRTACDRSMWNNAARPEEVWSGGCPSSDRACLILSQATALHGGVACLAGVFGFGIPIYFVLSLLLRLFFRLLNFKHRPTLKTAGSC